jgi:hypothetical protein
VESEEGEAEGHGVGHILAAPLHNDVADVRAARDLGRVERRALPRVLSGLVPTGLFGRPRHRW